MEDKTEWINKESCRNLRTKLPVVLYLKKELKDGFYNWGFYVRCTEHGTLSERIRNITEARKIIHRPWGFCSKCHKIVFGYSGVPDAKK